MKTIGILLVSISLTCKLCAGVVFNTFGPGDTFNPLVGNTAAWIQTTTFGKGVAAAFSVNGGNYVFDSVTVALDFNGPNSKMNLLILQDSAGAPTGALVETVTSDLGAVSNMAQVVTLDSSLHPVLANGARYWLVLEPPASNLTGSEDDAVYNWNSSGFFGPKGIRDFDFVSGNWLPWAVNSNGRLPAFRIEGTLVPEPSALWLLLGGVGWLGLRGWAKARLRM